MFKMFPLHMTASTEALAALPKGSAETLTVNNDEEAQAAYDLGYRVASTPDETAFQKAIAILEETEIELGHFAEQFPKMLYHWQHPGDPAHAIVVNSLEEQEAAAETHAPSPASAEVTAKLLEPAPAKTA